MPSEEVLKLSHAELKDVIRAHQDKEGFEDSPPLNSAETTLEAYVQSKVDAGLIDLGGTDESSDSGSDAGSDTGGDVPEANTSEEGDDSASDEDDVSDADVLAALGINEDGSDADESGQAGAQASVKESDEDELDCSELIGEGERVVAVALLQPVFLKSGNKKTFPEFDDDGVPTTVVKVGIEIAKNWKKNGICQING